MKKIIDSVFGRERFLRVTLPIILVIVLAIIGWASFRAPLTKNLTTDQAKTAAESFVNKYLMQAGNKATIKEVTDEYGLYKLKIDIVSDVVESYLSKDGKLFFPQALDIAQISQSGSSSPSTVDGQNAGPVATVSNKSDKPKIELFVMSYCPYGTQIEKGILPVAATLGNNIDFQIKFVDYAMHGQKELTENLNQFCIQKNEPTKFSSYLSCFLNAEDSASCVTSAGVNKSKMDSCVAATDKEFKVTENATNQVGYQGSYPSFNLQKDDNTKYGVGGSPTLVINGQEISSNRDPASLLATICSAFNNAPKECQTTLASATPAPGFGAGTTAAGSGSAANCAPVN